MRTIEITTHVKSVAVANEIRAVIAKMQKIKELLASGIHPSQIPDDLKIRFKHK